jgi:hypothetical protein
LLILLGLLNRHLPLELLLLLSDLLPLQIQGCRVVRGSTATAKAHESILVLLLKVNGTQHANHVPLPNVDPDLTVSPVLIWAAFGKEFVQLLDQ